jgi:hypothetical protein
MYVIAIKSSHDAESTRMFTAGNLMAFTCHVFIEKLLVGASFQNPTTASCLVTSK